jgi:hypothetical protein
VCRVNKHIGNRRACLTIRSSAEMPCRRSDPPTCADSSWLDEKHPVNRPVEQIFFYRLAKFVMSRAIPIGLAGAALLVALGLPFFTAKWGLPGDRVLPTSPGAGRPVPGGRVNRAAGVSELALVEVRRLGCVRLA